MKAENNQFISSKNGVTFPYLGEVQQRTQHPNGMLMKEQKGQPQTARANCAILAALFTVIHEAPA